MILLRFYQLASKRFCALFVLAESLFVSQDLSAKASLLPAPGFGLRRLESREQLSLLSSALHHVALSKRS
jgi:hypothetical protein